MTQIALQDYVQQISEFIENRRADEAVAHCRHILRHYPRHVDTYRALAEALLERGDHDGAVDVMQRVLSADPNNFTAFLGLALAYQKQGLLDQAVWHMERALEMKPYNSALQTQLWDLYVEVETAVPRRMQLSQEALARLYLQGEMYQAAVGELRQIMGHNGSDDRIDLQVLLAEALWRDNQRVEAVSLCLDILDDLPNCIQANAILAETWLQTGRAAEAQTYLQRLQSLTQPDKANLDVETMVGRAFAAPGAPTLPEQITLEFFTGEVEPEPMGEATPWGDDFAPVTDEELDQAAEGEYAWLEGVDFGDTEPADTAVPPKEEAVMETNWFVDPVLSDVDEEEEGLPDWLQEDEEAAASEPAPESAAAEPEPLVDEDSADSASYTDMFAELGLDTSPAEEETPAEEASETDASFTDMFAELEADTSPVEEEEAPAEETLEMDAGFTDMFADLDFDEDEETAVPQQEEDPGGTGFTEMFAEFSTDPFPETEGEDASEHPPAAEQPAAAEQSAAAEEEDEQVLPDWMSEVEEAELEPLSADDPSLDTDLLRMADEDEDDELFLEEEAAVPEGTAGAEEEDLEWLDSLAEAEEEADVDEMELEPLAADDAVLGSDWLQMTEDEEEALGEEPALDETAVDEAEAIPDLDSRDQLKGQSEEVPTWLLGSDLEAEEATEEDAWLAEPEADATDAIPDLDTKDMLGVAEDADIPDWLLDSEEEAETAASETAVEPEKEAVDAPTPDLDTSDALGQADVGIPTWLLGGDLELEEPAEEPAEEPVEETTAFDDDLAQLAMPAEEEAEEEAGWTGADIPTWLLDEDVELDSQAMTEDAVISDSNEQDTGPEEKHETEPDAESAVPELPEEEKEELDWLTTMDAAESDEETVSLDDMLAAETDVEPEEKEDSASYASRIAAGEGDPLDEMPTQVSLPEEPEAEEPTKETAEGAETDTVFTDDLDWLGEIEEEPAELTDAQPTLDWSEDDASAELAASDEEAEVEEEVAPELMEDLEEDMSWLDQMASEPELTSEGAPPSAETEGVPPVDAAPADVEEDSMMWLDDLESMDVVEEVEAAIEREPEEKEEEPKPQTGSIELPPGDEPEDLSWLDELASVDDDEVVVDDFSVLEEAPATLADEAGDEEIIDESVAPEPESIAEEESEAETAVPEDLDDAMAWLEQLAASQGAPTEELPSIADVIGHEPPVEEEADVTTEPEPEEADEAVEWDLETAIEPDLESLPADDAAVMAEVPEDLDDAMAWLEELAAKQGTPLEELPSLEEEPAPELIAEPETTTAAEEEPEAEPVATLAEEPPASAAEEDDLTAELDRLAQLAMVEGADLESIDLEAAPTPSGVEDLDDVLDWLEQDLQPEPAPEVVAEDAAVETVIESEVETEPAAADPEDEMFDLSAEMPEDPDEAMAWLEQLAARQGAPLEELPSVATTDGGEEPEAEPVAAADFGEAVETEGDLAPTVDTSVDDELGDLDTWIEEMAAEHGVTLDEISGPEADMVAEDLEPEKAVSSDTAVPVEAEETEAEPVPETEAPADVDDAMAWLEELAAEQGTSLDEETEQAVVDEADDVAESTVEAVESVVEPTAEQETESEVEAETETEVEPEEADFVEESDFAGELDESFPDWLDLEDDDEERSGQTDWLSSLAEPDVTGWLESEEEASASSLYDRNVQMRYEPQPDLQLDAEPPPPVEVEPVTDTDELIFEEVTPTTSVLDLDQEKLTEARKNLQAGEFLAAISDYQDLVDAGAGLMTVIADLETAANANPGQPMLRHLLGDAYMRNGQLQRALDTYRVALDHL